MRTRPDLLILFVFLGAYLHADFKTDEVYVTGPKLTLEELWGQVAERSPYVLGAKLPEGQLSLHVDGLMPVRSLISKTEEMLRERQYVGSARVVGRRIIFDFISPASMENSSTPASVPPEDTISLPEEKTMDDQNEDTMALKEVQLEKVEQQPIEAKEDSPALGKPGTEEVEDAVLAPVLVETSEPEVLELESPEVPPSVVIAQPSQIVNQAELPSSSTPGEEFLREPLIPQKEISKPPEIRRKSSYQLKPGDKIEISVWGEDMTRELVVSPDGTIAYILIGEIDVLGMTFRDLKAYLEDKLSRYLLEPNVTVIGMSYEGNFVSILGAVSRPGRKVVASSDRVLDVISKAQGLRYEEFGSNQGEIANLKNAYLSRKGEIIPVDFEALLYRGDMTQNIPVEIGDFIYIPSSVGAPIFVTGEVRVPTRMPFRGNPSLLEAITQSSGFNTKANKTKVMVVRGGLEEPEVTQYSYYSIIKGEVANPDLEPGDIIYVPPTTLTRIERVSTQIIPFLDTIIKSEEAKRGVQDW